MADDHRAVLCDFGLSKLSLTVTNPSQKECGGPVWQSPELLEAAGLDDNVHKTFESDVYAFAITIAEV